MKLSDLWTPHGELSRRDYFCWGVLLMGAKCLFDFVVAGLVFGQQWSIAYYFYPPLDTLNILQAHGAYLLWMIFLGLPFAWAGIMLTLRRLRTAGLSRLLTLLFFVPVLNLLFFILLCVVPSRTQTPPPVEQPALGRFRRWMPENTWMSALLSLLLTTALGVAVVQWGEEILQQYAMGLFVLAPFTLGLVAALVHGARRPRKYSECVSVTLASLLLIGVALLLLAFEGIICLIMALPLALPLALLGCTVGYHIQKD